MTELRSVYEVGPRLRKLRDEAPKHRGSLEVEGSFHVRPSSVAQRERDASDEGDWVVREALTSSAFLLTNAEEFFASIGHLLPEPFALVTLHVLARGVLDACGHALWLVDPQVSPDERAARVYAWAIHSQEEERKLAHSVNNRKSNSRAEAGSVEQVAEQRRKELIARRNARGLPNRGRPAATQLAQDLAGADRWLGESLFRTHSGSFTDCRTP